ncbi:MAG: VWA domain-containing protein, partial [Pseudonocardiaceae bacterium]
SVLKEARLMPDQHIDDRSTQCTEWRNIMGSSSIPTGTKVDVYFLSDSTGSMGSQLDSVKKNASSILEKVRATGADVQFGVGNYKDFSDGGKVFSPQQTVTADLGSVATAINEWDAGGGGHDIPEAQLYALDQLATRDDIGWRSGAQRIVVWFGDAPGHDPICKAISGLSYDITEESVTRKLKDQRIRVAALSTPSGLDHDPRKSAQSYVSQCGEPGGRPGQATRIATATGGSHTTGVGTDAIADTIVERVHTQISHAPLRGPLLSWGAHDCGALGHGNQNRKVPVGVDGDLTDITSVAAGHYCSAVALADGTVRTWGRGDWGQLGNGTLTNSSVPVQPPDVDGVRGLRGRSLAVSWYMLAIRDGAVWSWGANDYGQLGDGTTHGAVPTTRRKTLATDMTTPITEVANGEHHSLALDADGRVWAWGKNSEGQLGTGDKERKDRPVQVAGLGKITAIAAGWNFSLALDEDGTVWAWGHGWCGVLGNGKDEKDSSTPARVRAVGDVGPLKHVAAIAAGYPHCLALLNDGTVAAWGSDVEGQGGYSQGGRVHPTPQKVHAVGSKNEDGKELTDVIALAAGWYHSLALLADGTVAAWGLNDYGQLGDGTNTKQPTPVKVIDPTDKTKELSGVRSIAAGWRHSIAACG